MEFRHLNRRQFLTGASLLTASAFLPMRSALAQAQKIRIGLMLPYTGTYAQLGTAITNGFKLAVTERSGKLGGRELDYFTVDDEAEPAKAPENTRSIMLGRNTLWRAEIRVNFLAPISLKPREMILLMGRPTSAIMWSSGLRPVAWWSARCTAACRWAW